MIDLTDRRKEYTQTGLDESALSPTPFGLFDAWLHIALESNLPEPYAMTLATATTDGAPSARIVLLRKVDERGFVFFTNYLSRKGGRSVKTPAVRFCFIGRNWKGRFGLRVSLPAFPPPNRMNTTTIVQLKVA